MKKGQIGSLLALALGLALFAAVILSHDWDALWSALQTAGASVFLVAAMYVFPLVADGIAWVYLFPATAAPGITRATLWRWISQAVNSLLPAAHIGGEFVRGRLATNAGFAGPLVAATILGDLMSGVVTQVVFSLLGLAAFAWIGVEADGVVGIATAAGVLLMGGLVGFAVLALDRNLLTKLVLALQRVVGRLPGGHGSANADLEVGPEGEATHRDPGPQSSTVVDTTQALHAAIQEILRRKRRLALALVWRLAGWVLGAIEVWLAFRVLGYPIGVAEALLIESLVQAGRTAAFLIPGGLGVQESILSVVAAMLGLPNEAGVAVALIKRIREVLIGLPGLALWPALEGRRLFSRST